MNAHDNPETGSRLAQALRLTMEFWAAGGGDEQGFLAAHADLRDLLEGLLSDPGDHDEGAGTAPSEPGAGAPVAPRLPQIAGYVLEHELGRGGMGIVYAAVQRSLGRRVALKLLSNPALAHERALWRFQRESQLLAKLEHPGIVRVLDAGVADGTPYFAMEYVAGAPLSAVLDAVQRHGLATATAATVFAAIAGASTDDAPAAARAAADARTYVEMALDLAAQVADALAFAHAAGVIHRDVKPSNVLVRQDGRAVLSDFGIARLEGGPALTVTGDFAGTPYYVSPEQARRQSVDHRSDIFSLGVLLFELLTMQRPFSGADTAAVLEAILRREPTDSRRLNPAVSADLAAVVAKALAKEPAHRYQGVGELAADLRAAQRGLPVTARHPSVVQRLRRWARREPWRAAAAATASLAAAAMLVLTIVFTDRLLAETQRTKNALAAAEANLDQAMAAVDEMLEQAGDDDVAAVPQMVQVRRQMLQRALAFYTRFTAQKGNDAVVRLRAAVAQGKVARVRRLLGDDRAAVELGTKAVSELEALSAASPGDTAIAYALGSARLNLASAYMGRQDIGAARALFATAVTTLAGLDATGGGDTQRRWCLAQALHGSAQLEVLHDTAAAQDLMARALTELDELCRSDPDEARFASLRTDELLQMASVMRRRGDIEGAEKQLQAAAEAAEELSRRDAGRFDARRLVCAVQDQLALLYKSTGRLPQAEAAASLAVRRWREVVAQWPQIPNSRALGLRALIGLANIERYLGKFDAAAATAGEALTAAEQLSADFPDTAEYRSDLAAALYNVGSIRLRHFDDVAAREGRRLLERAHAAWERLHHDDPTNGEYAYFLASTLNELAFAHESISSWSEAAATYQRAADVYAELATLHDGVPDYRDAQANALRGRAQAEFTQGQVTDAATTLAPALAILRADLAQDGRAVARRRFARMALELQLRICAEREDDPCVAATLAEMVALIDAAEDVDPGIAIALERMQATTGATAAAHADQIVAMLRRVVDVDLPQARALLDDERLAPLRGHAGFAAVRRMIRD